MAFWVLIKISVPLTDSMTMRQWIQPWKQFLTCLVVSWFFNRISWISVARRKPLGYFNDAFGYCGHKLHHNFSLKIAFSPKTEIEPSIIFTFFKTKEWQKSSIQYLVTCTWKYNIARNQIPVGFFKLTSQTDFWFLKLEIHQPHLPFKEAIITKAGFLKTQF